MAEKIRVLIADDHPVVRQGLARLIATRREFELVGEACDGLEAVSLDQKLHPDVIVIDLNMPKCGGLEAIRLLQHNGSRAKPIVLTISENEADLLAAMKSGARGYVVKETGVQELLDAISAVSRGEAVIAAPMASKMLQEFRQPPAKGHKEMEESALTQRETEILGLLGQGATNKEIAGKLFISEHTVKIHVRNTLAKLHLRNRTEVAVYAAKMGLLKEQ